MASHWLKNRHETLKKSAFKIVDGERVIRAIPWEDGIPKQKCPYCGFEYEGSVDWKLELYRKDNPEQYKDSTDRWGKGLPYKVDCLNCGKKLIFDPEKKKILFLK